MGKLMDLGIFSFNGTFPVALIKMVTAILYITFVVENPKAFINMKETTEKITTEILTP